MFNQQEIMITTSSENSWLVYLCAAVAPTVDNHRHLECAVYELSRYKKALHMSWPDKKKSSPFSTTTHNPPLTPHHTTTFELLLRLRSECISSVYSSVLTVFISISSVLTVIFPKSGTAKLSRCCCADSRRST